MVSLSDHSSARANRTVVVAAALLLLIGLLGVWLVFRFVNSERERELQQWQIRLGIVAESRAAAISEWVETQYETLNDLAENASLQLYLTELMLVQGDRALVTDESAQAQYLSNLLTATAERSGFDAASSGPRVAANVDGGRVELDKFEISNQRAGFPCHGDGIPARFGWIGRDLEQAAGPAGA